MSNGNDPITKLTRAEKEFIDNVLSKWTHDEILERLKQDLQTAAWIELATIPIYLYTYYSIKRTNADMGWQELSDRYLYANKAGGIIMSVAVEEMLHMSLSANILYSLGVDPQLYGKSPSPYPTPLPYHNPVGPPGPHGGDKVLIPLSKLGYEQFWHFLQIEYPEARDALPEDQNWDTIGQFYSFIRCLICSPQMTDDDFRVRGSGSDQYQIQPYNYSPNNIDTVYPTEKFDPWAPPSPSVCTEYPSASAVAQYPNQPDSHAGPAELITIASKLDAIEALDTICDQGEGYSHESTDDLSKSEDSHYFKFLKLQAQLDSYEKYKETLPSEPKPPDAISPTMTDVDLAAVTYDFPDNPTTASYTEDANAVAWSNLCNGLYQYMLIGTETTFKVPDPQQKLFFNRTMHNSMIWLLDKVIQQMRGLTIAAGVHKGKSLAPTFENYDLGERKSAYENLLQLTMATAGTQQWTSTFETLPNLDSYWT